MKGYIKLHRKLLENEWHDDPITMAVWVYCLLRANYETSRWHGEIIQPGQFITSYAQMAKDVGVSVRQLRTALDHLKATRQVTRSATKTATRSATLITIENWAEYQSAGERATRSATRSATSEATSDRQATDKQPTTDKEYKNINNSFEESERDKRESPEEIPDIRLAERYDPVQYHTEEESNQMLKQAHELYAPIKARIALEAQERIKARETQA